MLERNRSNFLNTFLSDSQLTSSQDVTGGVVSEGGTEISAVLKDPAGDIPVTVVDNGDGTYSCSYTPRTAGPIPLEVNMKTNAFGEGRYKSRRTAKKKKTRIILKLTFLGPIAGAPFTPLIAPSVVDPSRSIATGEGTTSAQYVAIFRSFSYFPH